MMSQAVSTEAAPAASGKRVPFVRYLELTEDGGHLVADQCAACSARYFDQRLACAKCGHREFERVPLPREGTIGSFTIVHRASPGVVTPYTSAVVYLEDSTAVKANIVGCPADPEHVRLNMKVRLVTYTAAKDAAQTEAIAFAFEPAHDEEAGK